MTRVIAIITEIRCNLSMTYMISKLTSEAVFLKLELELSYSFRYEHTHYKLSFKIGHACSTTLVQLGCSTNWPHPGPVVHVQPRSVANVIKDLRP